MSPIDPSVPTLFLGTAMWGWTVDRQTAFQMLDLYYDAGFREIDTATNYPIDKNPEHFRMAEALILEWIHAHRVKDLKVTIKVGSVNNLGTPDSLLSKSFLLMNLEDYHNKFRENLSTFMIHWDNRDDQEVIHKSMEALQTAQEKGLRPGLSGIRYPGLYHEALQDFPLDFQIQIKHNLLQSDYAHYAPFHGKRRFVAYGISAGGIKLEGDYNENSSLRVRGKEQLHRDPRINEIQSRLNKISKTNSATSPSTFYEIGMIHAFHSPDIYGILIGPSMIEQMEMNLSFFQELKEGNYLSVFDQFATL
jgi:aryl-alcohol dehydrogenase-like predicted oxidoreductase